MTFRGRFARLELLLEHAWALEARRPGFWKVLGLCVAASFALWQYFSIQSAATTARTMEYIKRYEDGRVADARRGISAKMRPFMPSLNRIADPSAQDHAKMFYAIQESNPAIVDDIDTVVDFFEGLKTCVEEKLCSRSVAIGYFGASEARDFWRNFKAYIDERRANNKDYATGLEWFVRHSGDVQ